MRLMLLAALALSVSAQDIPLFTKDFPPEEFAARRNKIYSAIGDKAIAVLQGAPVLPSYMRFRQTNDFYYLCGIEVPHAYLMLDGATRKATLYLPHRNQQRDTFEGKTLSAEDTDLIKQLAGVDAIEGNEMLGDHLARMARSGGRTLYTPMQPAELASMSRDLALRAVADAAADPWDGRPSREGNFIRLLHERFPVYEIKDLSPVLDEARKIKSEREVSILRRSTKLAGLALMEGMRSTRPGQVEHELDGMAKFIFFRNGAQGEAYYSLIASGQNAFYPHYNAGKRTMDSGDFLLMDFAPDVAYYQSDVTRMWPVNGKFSDWQKELYTFYLGCYESILKHIRPRVPVKQIQTEAIADMKALRLKSTFSRPIYAKAADDFIARYEKSLGRLGHFVGMSTHDVGSAPEVLEPGMVFTIEPALTVPEEKAYVRLEDMILITDKGAEILSDFVPRSLEGIEKLMKEQGILKTYPKAD